MLTFVLITVVCKAALRIALNIRITFKAILTFFLNNFFLTYMIERMDHETPKREERLYYIIIHDWI